MLRIYEVALTLIESLVDTAEAIGRKDPHLESQLRRSLWSMSLNIAEGSGSQGRNRNARYFNALGSSREALACLQTARAFRIIKDIPFETEERFRAIIGTLRVVTR